MLRITELPIDDATVLLVLEGKLLGPWVEEFRAVVSHSSKDRRLDLSGLTFADTEGVRLLADLLRHGATLARCSGFLSSLLPPEVQ